MARRNQLEVLVDLAEHRSNAAAHDLALLNKQGEQNEVKLQLLRAYLAEYRARLDELVREGLDGVRLRNYLSFLSRVERAVADQSAEVEKDRERIEIGRERWQAEERKRRTFETLVDRRTRESRLADARIQQKQSDEFGSRAALRLINTGR